jgi:hypothetical protein
VDAKRHKVGDDRLCRCVFCFAIDSVRLGPLLSMHPVVSPLASVPCQSRKEDDLILCLRDQIDGLRKQDSLSPNQPT